MQTSLQTEADNVCICKEELATRLATNLHVQ